MEWAEWINQKKQEWVGEIVLYDGWYYWVEDVDSNGALMIDRASQFNDTTAVSENDVQKVSKSSVVYGRKWTINSLDDLTLALAVLCGNEFVANMSDSYVLTCAEVDEVKKQRKEVFDQASRKGLFKGVK